jgi:aspartyl-tRNA(Asn)/glutamyl-tRNA(Gln) amidotransferase subunit A
VQLYELGAAEAVALMRRGELSPVELTQTLLDRIAETDPRVQAWETLDADGELAAARSLEDRRQERLPRSTLFGLPVGIKDVFDVRALPTTANFDPYRDRVAPEDSGVVRHLREAGAIILGKTVTVQFACGRDSPKTRNPWDLERTPGGSSSGSGAAVAARQVPAAIGTQTGGSTLRPAAYCGVVAIKPTFGRLSRTGLLPVSWSLDHPGIIVRSVADAALLLQALARHDPADPFSARQGPEDFVGAAQPGPPPRLGLVRDLLDRADPPVRRAAEAAAERLVDAGAEVREVHLPVSMDQILAVHFLHQMTEVAAVHAEQYATLAEHYTPGLRSNIEVGQLLPGAAYVQATRLRRRFRGPMLELAESVDGLVAPTARNLPPDRSSTGDPSFQSVWTLFGLPNMSLPTGLSPERLPHAIQIVGRPFEERRLLQVAAWCEARFDPLPSPL